MEKDLFGNTKRKRKNRLEVALDKYDSSSYSDRLERLKYINKITPKNIGYLYSIEMHYLHSEAIQSFINGQFVGVLLLAQSFIEHWLDNRVENEKIKKYGNNTLANVVKVMKENNSANQSLLDRIDRLRKIRNPFVHCKPSNYEFNVMNLSLPDKIMSDDLLCKEAKEAISLLYQVSMTKFN
jgi:hypothetical protein